MGLILPRIPPQTPVLYSAITNPFLGYMYIHKTPPTPPQNTIFPCLKLKVGEINCCLGKMYPVCAKCLKIGQIFSRSGQKKIIHHQEVSTARLLHENFDVPFLHILFSSGQLRQGTY